jgi:MFS family permease
VTSEAQRPNDPTTQRPSSSYKWAVVGMLWFICFFNYADRVAVGAVFPKLEAEFGFDKEQLGHIGAAFTWVYALTAPMAGSFGDRYARKTVILVGFFVWSAVTGLTALCTKFWHFVTVRGAEGLGETFYFPASMSLVSDYHDQRTRSRAMGLHQTSVYAGTIGGSALAGWLAQEHGWRVPFIAFGIAGVALGIILNRAIREPRRTEPAPDKAHEAPVVPFVERPWVVGLAPLVVFASSWLGGVAARALYLREYAAYVSVGVFVLSAWALRNVLVPKWFRLPSAGLLAAAFFSANFVALVFLTWMPTFLKEKYGLKLGMAGLEATVYIQLASMVGAGISGVIADRWASSRPGGRILVQASGALIGAPFIFLCGDTREKGTLVLAMTFFGLAKGLYDGNIWASLFDVVPAARRAAAVGLMNMYGWLGGGLGAWAIGAAVTRGYTMSEAISSTAGIYLGVAAMLAVAGLLFAPRDIHRQVSSSSAPNL